MSSYSKHLYVLPLLATGLAAWASAQNLTYTANPPRVQVTVDQVSPFGLPQCRTSDPASPTPGILYCYAPRYIWTAYNILPVFQSGNFGQGQTIVIVDAFGSPTIQQDLQTFHNAFFGPAFPAPDFEVLCPMGCPTFNPRNAPQAEINWTFETSLDVEWAHAIAPLAKIKLVVAPTPHGDAINNAVAYAVAKYPGSIISQSFGIPEAGFRGNNSQFMQALANYSAALQRRITVLASSGDLGATNGTYPVANAGYPASDPFVTSVGGTQGLPLGNLVTLSGTCAPPVASACTPTGYGAEQVWNERMDSGGWRRGCERILRTTVVSKRVLLQWAGRARCRLQRGRRWRCFDRIFRPRSGSRPGSILSAAPVRGRRSGRVRDIEVNIDGNAAEGLLI
jgi:subtilase family serine protease